MKVKFTNLAHINSAEYEDNSLTVILGDNGSGKTLMLETVSLIRSYYKDKMHGYITKLNSYKNLIDVDVNFDEINLSKVVNRSFNMKKINETKSSMRNFNNIVREFNINFKIDKPKELTSALEKALDHEKEKIINLVNKNILMKEEVEESDFVFQLLNTPCFKNNQELKLDIFLSDDEFILRLVPANVKQGVYTRVPLFNSSNDILDIDAQVEVDKIGYNKLLGTEGQLEEILLDEIKGLYIKYKLLSYFGIGEILYLPSERNLIMDNSLLRAAELGDLDLKQRYSERIFNSAYLKYKSFTESIPDLFNERSEKNLSPLFGGKVVYGEDGEISSIEKEDGNIIKRKLFSTKQNRLIPFLLIESPLTKYENIIIEEPEAHLSLKSMKELVNYLTTLVLNNSQMQMVLSTHSDVFFSFLNNKLVKNENIKVNVYEFKEQNNNTSILEKKERGDYGFQVDLFTDILDELYEETILVQKKEAE